MKCTRCKTSIDDCSDASIALLYNQYSEILKTVLLNERIETCNVVMYTPNETKPIE